MSETLNEHQVRIQKLEALQAAGITTYVTKFARSHSILQLQEIATKNKLPSGEDILKT